MWFVIATMYVWILLAFSTVLPLWASEEYPRALERQKILDLIETIEQEEIPLRFSGYQSRTPQERRFLQFYRNNIHPVQMRERRLLGVAGLLYVALDRALYEDETEQKAWMKKKNELSVEAQEIFTAPEWKRAIREWARLSVGLKGRLAAEAREVVRKDRLSGFGVKELPLLKRLTELETIIAQKANESSVTGEHLSEYEKAANELEKQFRGREITLEHVKKRLQELWPKSPHAKGHDVLQRIAPLLNEAAIIRTQLAQSKGFENWAQYQLAPRKNTYKRGLRTVDDHIGFMEQVLSGTLESATRFRRAILADAGYTSSDAEGIAIGIFNQEFFMPEDDNLVGNYFIAEDVNGMWLETMRESGFDDSALMRINLDSFPRKSKHTHAYMANVLDTIPKVANFDTETFDFKLPSRTSGNYHPAAIFIVQNVISDGYGQYEVIFHEGGHALDYAYRRGVLEGDPSYAYTETSSMMMQRFFDDLPFLLAKGEDRNGNPLDQETAESFIVNKKLNKYYRDRNQYSNALFDLAVWNEPYTEDGPKFTERFLAIHDDLRNRYFPEENIWKPEGVENGSFKLKTGHFYSGNVRYHGYMYADMAAQMTADYLWDMLEKTTGRRTLYRQPTLAKLLIEGMYERGFTRPFPAATEEFTGRKLDPFKVIERTNQALDRFVQETNQRLSCKGLLKSALL